MRTTQTHALIVTPKHGQPWTNDAGQSFPGELLFRSLCSCGWKSGVYHSSLERSLAHFERHEREALERLTSLAGAE